MFEYGASCRAIESTLIFFVENTTFAENHLRLKAKETFFPLQKKMPMFGAHIVAARIFDRNALSLNGFIQRV